MKLFNNRCNIPTKPRWRRSRHPSRHHWTW